MSDSQHLLRKMGVWLLRYPKSRIDGQKTFAEEALVRPVFMLTLPLSLNS